MNAKNIRPKQGQVLVELHAESKLTDGGLVIPDGVRTKDQIGRMPARAATVISMGVWPTNRKGRMLAYEFRKGSVVMVDPALGTNLMAHPKALKLYDHSQILAVI